MPPRNAENAISVFRNVKYTGHYVQPVGKHGASVRSVTNYLKKQSFVHTATALIAPPVFRNDLRRSAIVSSMEEPIKLSRLEVITNSICTVSTGTQFEKLH